MRRELSVRETPSAKCFGCPQVLGVIEKLSHSTEHGELLRLDINFVLGAERGVVITQTTFEDDPLLTHSDALYSPTCRKCQGLCPPSTQDELKWEFDGFLNH
jgi:hypothetical protein